MLYFCRRSSLAGQLNLFQALRDMYREICGGQDGAMNETLVFRFIETQALILSPICPHIGEQIWQILGKVSRIR